MRISLMLSILMLAIKVSHAQSPDPTMTYEVSVDWADLLPYVSEVKIDVTASEPVFKLNKDYADPVTDYTWYSVPVELKSTDGEWPTARWDWDNHGNNPKLGFGIYMFEYEYAPSHSISFQLNLLHCPDEQGSSDIKFRIRKDGTEYWFEYKTSSRQWDETPSMPINIWDYRGEDLDRSCLTVGVGLKNEYKLSSGGDSDQYGSLLLQEHDATTFSPSTYSSPATVQLEILSDYYVWPEAEKTNSVETGIIHRFAQWNYREQSTEIVYDMSVLYNEDAIAEHKIAVSSKGHIIIDGIASSGSMLIRDPWLVERPANQMPSTNRTFNIYSVPTAGFNFGDFTSYGGLHKGRAPTSSLYSYYTIRTSENVKWNVDAWDHTNPSLSPDIGDARCWRFSSDPQDQSIIFTNPINQSHEASGYITRDAEFREDDTEFYLDYKAHMLSSKAVSYGESASALSPNSQRKIGYLENTPESTDSFIVVYESDSKIWTMMSETDPISWRWEENLGSGVRPSLFTVADSAFITWLSGADIIVGKYHDGQFTSFDVTLAHDPASDASPVVAHAGDLTTIVYEKANSTDLAYAVIQCDDLLEEGTISPVSTSGDACVTPTMTANDGTIFWVAWREASDIATARINVRTYQQPVDVLIEQKRYIPRYNDYYVGAPSITNYHSTQSAPNNVYRVLAAPARDSRLNAKINVLAQNSAYQWSNMQSIFSNYGTTDIWAPSVSAIDVTPCSGSFDNVRCAFNTTRTDVYPTAYETRVLSVSCGTWSVTNSQVSNAIHPSVVAYPPSGKGRGVHIDLTESNIPTPLTSSLCELGTTSSSLTKVLSQPLSEARILWVSVDTTHVGIGLGRMELLSTGATSYVSWSTTASVEPLSVSSGASNYIRSETFSVPASSVLKIALLQDKEGAQPLPVGSQLTVELVDAATAQVVRTISTVEIASLSSGSSKTNINTNLGSFSGMDLFIRFNVSGITNTATLSIADYYNIDPSSSEAFPKTDADIAVDSNSPIPSQVQLSQNYPNPFNPTTTISFSVPENGSVTLAIYDINGSVIREVISGHVEAGWHSQQVDLSDLPSGVYHYSLHHNGGMLTKKMTLTK